MEKVDQTTDIAKTQKFQNMPDVAGEPLGPSVLTEDGFPRKEQIFTSLDWVGMDGIEIPIRLESQNIAVMAKISAQVSLDLRNSRGIHMSRLYSLIQGNLSGQNLTLETLISLCSEFLVTHQGISSSARLHVQYNIPLLRKALKSELYAYRVYPVSLLITHLRGEIRVFQEVEILYSSTCPASAALARQLISRKFSESFTPVKAFQNDSLAGGIDMIPLKDVESWLEKENGLFATPHAQRSRALVRIENGAENLTEVPFEELIKMIEMELKTPVQTMVKREDEQEFALLNGQNLLFCEDAVRRIGAVLDRSSFKIESYWARVEHYESLHPHNAVAQISKNWSGSPFL